MIDDLSVWLSGRQACVVNDKQLIGHKLDLYLLTRLMLLKVNVLDNRCIASTDLDDVALLDSISPEDAICLEYTFQCRMNWLSAF